MTCLSVLDRGERGNDNGTGLKEGGGIEMSIYSASIHSIDNYNLVQWHNKHSQTWKKHFYDNYN